MRASQSMIRILIVGLGLFPLSCAKLISPTGMIIDDGKPPESTIPSISTTTHPEPEGYQLSSYLWPNTNISVSLMPDATSTEGGKSNLFATLDAVAPTEDWRREFARALQGWADASSLNFHFVSDSGEPAGTEGELQNDSRFGDIRLGGYRLPYGIAGTFYPGRFGTNGGDIYLGTQCSFRIGGYIDLHSVLAHEVGHALGLAHSTLHYDAMGVTVLMYPFYSQLLHEALSQDDSSGIRAIYGAREPDLYDAKTSNDTLARASVLNDTSIRVRADITTITDVDYYKFIAPSDFDGTVTVLLTPKSLLNPKVSVLDTLGNEVGEAHPDPVYGYGKEAKVELSGLSKTTTYYIRASNQTSDAFGTGAYELQIQFGAAKGGNKP